MTHLRNSMIETLEGRTMLSGHHTDAPAMLAAHAVQITLPSGGTLLFVSFDAAPSGNVYHGEVRHESGQAIGGGERFDRAEKPSFGRLPWLPPMPKVPKFIFPNFELPSEQPATPAQPPPAVSEPAPTTPDVTNHEDPQRPVADVVRIENSVEHANIALPDAKVANVSAAEVVDSSGSHAVIEVAQQTSQTVNVFNALFTQSASDPSGVAASAVRFVSAAPVAAANAIPAVAKSVDALLSTPKQLFHFERMSNPMALIGDAAAAFAEESALLGSTVISDNYTRACAITAGVVAFDAAVLMYWMHARKRRQMVAASGYWSFDIAGGEIA